MSKGAVTLRNVSCNLSRNVLATLWRDKLHETFHSMTYLATAKIVARQVARKVELNSTFGNGSCNMSRKDFGRCRVCYTVKCFLHLVPPQCRQNIARQGIRNISECNDALKKTLILKQKQHDCNNKQAKLGRKYSLSKHAYRRAPIINLAKGTSILPISCFQNIT